MTSAYILISAMLLLGGLIAALGDRLGTKVGKARLRIFNLRPRQTAMIVTVITGTFIVASTLGILFTLSESLRDGIFRLDEILQERRQLERELAQTTQAKEQVEQELVEIRNEQTEAQQKLDAIDRDFQASKEQLQTISEQSNRLRQELNKLLDERQKSIQRLEQLQTQSRQLQAQLQQREQQIRDRDRTLAQREARLQELERQQQVLQAAIAKRDSAIARLDEEIATKDSALQTRANQLDRLENQLAFLEREVDILEEYYRTYQELRERQIAIVKGQVLASATVRIIDPSAAISAVDRLLRQANRNAIQATTYGTEADRRSVKITKAQVQQLIEQLQDGRDYVVRILAAENYVRGEEEVRVFADLALNKQVFKEGEAIATVSIDSDNISQTEAQESLNWLLSASKFRAQRGGILGEIQVGDGQIATLIDFIEELTHSSQPVQEIKAVAAETTYTVGPLKLKLIAMADGETVFTTEQEQINPEIPLNNSEIEPE